jgi:MFS family permease
VSAGLRRSFSSLSVPNYRRYFAGQIVSVSGNWMQMVAEGWLVLTLTGSGVAVGIATASQFVPLLFLGAFGGLLADRFDKRRLLMITQALMALPALFLLTVTAADVVTPLMIYATAFTRGAVNALDNPARQSFAIEMVGPDRIVNAISLNSVIIHTSRIVGPAIAGAVIAVWGVAPCFGLNALSFIGMLIALARMSPQELRTPLRAEREPGAIRAGLRYVLRTRELLVPLVLMAIVGTFGFNFQVVLPLVARFTFGGDASTYALLLSAMAVGSVTGALINGARGQADARLIGRAAAAFGVLGLLAAAAPTLPLEIAVLVPLGMATVTFAASINSHLQLVVEPAMRGRVMALYSVVFLGSTPIGAPIAGLLSEAVGPRAGLVLAGASALVAAVITQRLLVRPDPGPRTASRADLTRQLSWLRARFRAQPRLYAHRRPAPGDRSTRRGDHSGRAVHDAARGHGNGEDVHDGGGHRAPAAAGAGDRAQQDPRGSAL